MKYLKTFAHLACAVTFIAFSWPGAASNEAVYYRYVNDKGVKVLNSTIPPRYAQKGYEVVNKMGMVIKVVEPAPTEEELAQESSIREMRARYNELRRRYKTTDEIQSAKRRRLASIDTNISILRGNISGLNTQVENFTLEAANIERQGRPVPQTLLQKIADTKAELAVAQDLLKIRQDEYASVKQQFDQDLTAFVKGETLTR